MIVIGNWEKKLSPNFWSFQIVVALSCSINHFQYYLTSFFTFQNHDHVLLHYILSFILHFLYNRDKVETASTNAKSSYLFSSHPSYVWLWEFYSAIWLVRTSINRLHRHPILIVRRTTMTKYLYKAWQEVMKRKRNIIKMFLPKWKLTISETI